MVIFEVFDSVEGNKEEIYPVTISKIASEQRGYRDLKYFSKTNKICLRIFHLVTEFL